MIEKLLTGRADEGLWIKPEVKPVDRVLQPNTSDREIRIPESVAYARLIQLDCLKRLKKGGK